ncbi:unnamed protein product [Ectocarpus sp. 6 AP-2014]
MFWSCCIRAPKQDPDQDRVVNTKHLSCPRCRRLLIVPNVDTFRCHCSLVFSKVRGAVGGTMQLCFSLSEQELHGQGCGLPRELVERLPVTVVTEEMCAKKKQQAVDANGEQAPKAEPIDDDSMTCRICLSDYQPGDKVRILPCFHRFHVSEIDDWLNRNVCCPLCHLDISKALTGSSGVAFVSVIEGNPRPVIERTTRA